MPHYRALFRVDRQGTGTIKTDLARVSVANLSLRWPMAATLIQILVQRLYVSSVLGLSVHSWRPIRRLGRRMFSKIVTDEGMYVPPVLPRDRTSADADACRTTSLSKLRA